LKKSKFKELLKDLRSRFVNDDLPSMSAQVTFFLVLSFSPFLIFLIALILYLPIFNLQGNIEALLAFMPINAYEILQDNIEQAITNKSGTLLFLSMLFALWSSINGVISLMHGINRAYDQEETRPFWKRIIVSLIFSIELIVAIMFSLILIVFGKILGIQIFRFSGYSDMFLAIWSYGRLVIAFSAIILVLGSLYYNIPNRSLKIREVIPGAIFASVGWVAISILFSFYANNIFNYPKVYGSLGNIIALLTWLYLSSITILMGAEINASLASSKVGYKKLRNRRF